jgi:hypothetical protein
MFCGYASLLCSPDHYIKDYFNYIKPQARILMFCGYAWIYCNYGVLNHVCTQLTILKTKRKFPRKTKGK